VTDPAFNRPCSVCGAPAGEGCRDDDGVPQPMTSMHFWRAMGVKPSAPLQQTDEETEEVTV
jgi:hypothetical protein